MGAQKYKISFQPDDVTVEAGDGDNLLELARASGVAINAACGGDGVCGTCKVLIEKGEVDSLPGMQTRCRRNGSRASDWPASVG